MPERSSSILSYFCIMQWITFIGGLLLAYLLGSIPTAVWVGKWFYGCDIRNEGSGNSGATNIIRVLGVKAGIPVILVDVLKGFLAVHFMTYFIPHSWDTNQRIYLLILAGFLAVIGHVYPVFASFKGGKGVATLLGMGIALFPNVIWIPAAVFVIVAFGSGYVSLGSMLGGLSFPLADILFYHERHPGKVIFSIVVALFLLYTHRQNIRRLWRGEENRFKRIKKT